MPMIYMTHPVHGAMHVYNDVDCATARAAGWTVAEFPEVVSEESEIDATRKILDSMGIAYDKRFGLSRLKELLTQ